MSNPENPSETQIFARRFRLHRCYPLLHPLEFRRRREIDRVCIGYSGLLHWRFFHQIASRTSIRRMCILGVYFGRDIAYVGAALRESGRLDCTITGVDKFEDRACADWPEEKKALSWREAGFGPAPSHEAAERNLQTLGLAENIRLWSGSDERFLETTPERFDFIYIDTSHDYASVKRLILRAWPLLRDGGLMAGDDFSDEGTWGVKRAVLESFAMVTTYDHWIWAAEKEDFRGDVEASCLP